MTDSINSTQETTNDLFAFFTTEPNEGTRWAKEYWMNFADVQERRAGKKTVH